LSTRVKFGVYLPEDLAKELQEFMKLSGVGSKSKVIQEALRLFVIEQRWRLAEGNVAGVLGVIYDHEVGNVDELLTDIQHRYLDVVVSTMHIHLDARNCMLAIAIKGNAEKVRKLISEIESIRGVKLVRAMLMTSD